MLNYKKYESIKIHTLGNKTWRVVSFIPMLFYIFTRKKDDLNINYFSLVAPFCYLELHA